MKHAASNILITGMPGVGKTTLIKKLLPRLEPQLPIGFYTEEIRQGGRRRGFRLVSTDGGSVVLSHVRIQSRYRVGRYGVDIQRFEAFLDEISLQEPSSSLVIIDEIGKMECFSVRFTRLLIELLDAPAVVIATVALKGGGIIETVKRRPDVDLFTLTRSNRDVYLETILHNIEPMLEANQGRQKEQLLS